jgi:hypothetical protein
MGVKQVLGTGGGAVAGGALGFLGASLASYALLGENVLENIDSFGQALLDHGIVSPEHFQDVINDTNAILEHPHVAENAGDLGSVTLDGITFPETLPALDSSGIENLESEFTSSQLKNYEIMQGLIAEHGETLEKAVNDAVKVGAISLGGGVAGAGLGGYGGYKLTQNYPQPEQTKWQDRIAAERAAATRGGPQIG